MATTDKWFYPAQEQIKNDIDELLEDYEHTQSQCSMQSVTKDVVTETHVISGRSSDGYINEQICYVITKNPHSTLGYNLIRFRNQTWLT